MLQKSAQEERVVRRSPDKTNGRQGGIGPLCALAGIILLIAAAGCTGQEGSTADNGTKPMTVAVTILPQKQFVESIAGEHARIVVLVPPGASPHTHEPTARQLEEISSAAVYVKVGSGIDVERAWMDKLMGVNPRMTIIDSSAGIPLIAGTHTHDHDDADDEAFGTTDTEGTDPHIWLSPANARIMVENTCRGLIEADPVHTAEYRANADAYQKKIDTLDAEIRQEIADKKVRTIMVYHPAWSYFARDYNLVQVPIETNGKDPSPAGLEQLIRQAKDEKITVIFASPESSSKSAAVIAEEIGGSVVLVSGLEEDYIGNLAKVSQAFARGGST
ncbi:MAG: zinc ABC transporter solute-binding protein [Methanomicrobiales archaeon]|nr:zinc ABC transporter solute-binding protein [Methanomicrobiales archaeon]